MAPTGSAAHSRPGQPSSSPPPARSCEARRRPTPRRRKWEKIGELCPQCRVEFPPTELHHSLVGELLERLRGVRLQRCEPPGCHASTGLQEVQEPRQQFAATGPPWPQTKRSRSASSACAQPALEGQLWKFGGVAVVSTWPLRGLLNRRRGAGGLLNRRRGGDPGPRRLSRQPPPIEPDNPRPSS